MAGDDFGKLLERKPIKPDNAANDFDDISSIYTTHAKNDLLESALKRVKDREQTLSVMEEMEDYQYLNN